MPRRSSNIPSGRQRRPRTSVSAQLASASVPTTASRRAASDPADPVVAALRDEAGADPASLGLVLTGSRGAGTADEHSDYDVVWVVTDAAYERRFPPGTSARRERRFGALPRAEIVYTCPRLLDETAREPGWWTAGYVDACVVLDKTGEVAEWLRRIAEMPEERAAEIGYEAYDAYLNSFVRSVRAWEKGLELGARLHASESAGHLVRALFALERRWAPYHDRLLPRLDALAGQGWPPGYLEETLLALVRTGDPRHQQELEGRVERLMTSRGVLAHEEWGDTLAHVKRTAPA